MISKQFVSDLTEGTKVSSVFLVKDRSLISYRNKIGNYLHMLLSDRSGEIEGRLWDQVDKLEKGIYKGNIVYISGVVVSYQESLQVKIENLRLANDDEIDVAAFVTESSRPISAMQGELQALASTMQSGPLNDLIQVFIASEYYEVFCSAPAAKTFHQNSRGGLMEHSLGVLQICLKITEIHSEIDRDLIMVGALFHDIGKIKEMDFFPAIEYTDAGKLLGHIVLGVQILDDLIRRTPGIDADLRNQLLHMITSHHGEYKWQSPKRPMFLEAKVVHLADMMDAEIWKFKSAVPTREGGKWSEYMKIIGNEVFLGNRAKD